MSARHPKSTNIIIKTKAIDLIHSTNSQLQKILNYGQPPVPPPITVAGGGQSVGSGTNYPLQPPAIDLGTKSGNITINLAQKTAQYQKITLHDAGAAINILFDGLPILKSIMFALDVVLDNNITHGLNWPATLNNIPTLPTTAGSRYTLYIVGYRGNSEIRYTVVNSAIGGGGSTLWSAITIDVDKDMLQHSLLDLNQVNFHSSGNRVGFDSDGAGHVLNFYVDGKQAATLNRNATGIGNANQIVAEVFDAFSSGFPAALKLAYLPASPVAGVLLGELDFDGYTDHNIQETWGKIVTKAVTITNAGWIGEVQFWVADGTGLVAQVFNIEGKGAVGNTASGINMLSHPIFECDGIFFDQHGAGVFEESDALCLQTVSSVGQVIFRFFNGITNIMEIGPARIQPLNSQDLGSTAHFFNNAYLTDIFLIDTSHEIFISGGDYITTIPAANVFRFRAGLNDKVQIDNNRNATSLRNGMFFEIQPASGNPLQVLKQNGVPAEFICNDGFQFDQGIIAEKGIEVAFDSRDPTTADVPNGACLFWYNTVTTTIRVYMNILGTLWYVPLTSHL